MQRHLWTTVLLSLAGAAPALADPAAPPPPPTTVTTTTVTTTTAEVEPRPTRGFAQLQGTWGVNLGQTEYLPNGTPGDFKHPFAHGFGAGVTLGYNLVAEWLSAILDYRFGHTSTRTGDIVGVLTSARGELNFHELTAGVRMAHPLGTGTMYGQIGAGVLFPFSTTREIVYADPVAQIGLVGQGFQTDNFGWGVGAQAEVGYTHDLWFKRAPVYVGVGLRIASFQASNNGRSTELNNFVVDFATPTPTPVTASIRHTSNGSALDAALTMPTTYSVQDVRLDISIGARF